ncbi:hypothetical protein [Enterococcus canis]|nr:hypothetical protein [Enterococcus canis]
MAHTLRKEWEKLFGKKHDLDSLKTSKVDQDGHFISDAGIKTEVLGHHDVDSLNRMMTSDWSAFLDGSDVFSELDEQEQNELRSNGPAYDEYNGD